MIETKLYGKNLCNLLCNQIIMSLTLQESNHITNIKVVNLNKFIVVQGTTSVSNPLNLSSIFNSYLSDKFNYNSNINVIDLIDYNHKNDKNGFIIEYSRERDVNNTLPYTNQKYQGNIKIDSRHNILYSCNKTLLNEFSDSDTKYKVYEKKVISDYNVYESDDMYGQNLGPLKVYNILFNYISHNLFERHLLKDVTFNMRYSGEDISDISWETIDFHLESKSCIVNIDWLKSLILDLFNFEYNNVVSIFNLKEYDFSEEILSDERIWEKRDKVGEMFLF